MIINQLVFRFYSIACHKLIKKATGAALNVFTTVKPYCELLQIELIQKYEIFIVFSNPNYPKMKILGLDLGVSSIGWALIERKENETKILGGGTRIIPLSVEENDEFTRGNAISKNRNRTLKRSARRNQHRYKLRKHKLHNVLVANNMLPSSELFIGLPPLTLYTMRAKAVHEQVTLTELGRILFHINQKRGYKGKPTLDNNNNSKEEESSYLEAIASRTHILEANNWTVGEFLLKQLSSHPRASIKGFIFPREKYIEEFNSIWDTQSKFYPNLTKLLKEEIRDTIIFYQRPLKSQKHLVSECRYERHHKVAPKSSPLFQICKIWESINNITIKDKNGTIVPITIEQKKELYTYLNNHDSITGNQLIKRLGLIPATDYYPNLLISKKGIEGNKTYSQISRVFKKNGCEYSDFLNFNLSTISYNTVNTSTGEIIKNIQISKEFQNEPLYNLWHVIYSSNNEDVIKILQTKFGFSHELSVDLAVLDFKSWGYGNKSARAMRKIIPQLMEGNIYSEACRLAGYRHSDFETKEELSNKVLKTRLNPIKRNSLRNPVVEKILNQLVNLVNAIIENPDFGSPDEIRIELARELKQNINKRKEIYKRNNEMDRAHKIISERLSEMGFKNITRSLIEKWKLYHEVDGFSLYTGNKVELSSFLRGDDFDVEHIIPQSRLFDDSFLNKTICETHENRLKGNQTAFDYMQSKGEEAFSQFIEMVNSLVLNKKISEAKRDKFLMSGQNIPTDFISRQLRETQYIAAYAKVMMQEICNRVYTTTGSVTDYLRHLWGYDDILKRLSYPNYHAVGLTEVVLDKDANKHRNIITGWNKRNDQRHHALDALIIASTKQQYIKQLNNLNQYITTGLKKIDIGADKPFSVQQMENFISGILVSYKPGKRLATKSKNSITGQISLTPRNFLHKETVYGNVQRYHIVNLSPKFKEVDKIVNEHHKALVMERINTFNGDLKMAFGSLKKDPIWLNDEKTEKLENVTILTKYYVLRTPLNDQFKVSDVDAIVDEEIKRAVRKRLEEYNGNPKEAFQNLEQNPIWAHNNKENCINSVRIFVSYEELEPLHKNEKGQPIDYVIKRNNHHVAIYEDSDGNRSEEIVSFWEAYERKKIGVPVIRQENEDGAKLKLSLQVNEMVVIGLDPNEIDFENPSNYAILSKHLYRVQSLSSRDYYFRHHLETKIENNATTKAMKKYVRLKSISGQLPIKISIANLGIVKQVWS